MELAFASMGKTGIIAETARLGASMGALAFASMGKTDITAETARLGAYMEVAAGFAIMER